MLAVWPLFPDFGAQTDTPGHVMHTAKAACIISAHEHRCTAHTHTSVGRHTHADTVTCMETQSHACSGPLSADIHTTCMKPPGLFAHVHPESRLPQPPGNPKLSLLSPLTFSSPIRQVGSRVDPQCAARRSGHRGAHRPASGRKVEWNPGLNSGLVSPHC